MDLCRVVGVAVAVLVWSAAASELPSQCLSAVPIPKQSERLVTSTDNSGDLFCDDKVLDLTTWYKYPGHRLPQRSPGGQHCGTYAAGWLDGAPPEEVGETKAARVCFASEGDDCTWPVRPVQVQITNCGWAYVYQFNSLSSCFYAFCFEPGGPPACGFAEHNLSAATAKAQGRREDVLKARGLLTIAEDQVAIAEGEVAAAKDKAAYACKWQEAPTGLSGLPEVPGPERSLAALPVAVAFLLGAALGTGVGGLLADRGRSPRNVDAASLLSAE